MSAIEWTDKTWNPARGCARVSAGCEHCYAEKVAARFSGEGMPYEGLVTFGKKGPRWSGRARFVPEKLNDPRRWRKPARVFVNSMSDLFHEDVTDGQILHVFEVMLACPQHTFQILTKRPERAREWFRRWADTRGESREPQLKHGPKKTRAAHPSGRGQMFASYLDAVGIPPPGCALPTFDWEEGMRWWPAASMTSPNVWLGVSVEDQKTADERIPLLLECPAAVRFVSYEPALGPVDFDLPRCDRCGSAADAESPDGAPWCSEHDCECSYGHWLDPLNGGLSWVIVGGESGPGARPFDLLWALSTIEQCAEARVACFVKQLGADPFSSHDGLADALPHPLHGPTLRDRKGGDMSEWPEPLRVREFPEERR